MTAIRAWVRQGALLALFALAIQLVLSFGHFHAEGILEGASNSARPFATAHLTREPFAPSHRHIDGLVGSGCAICASILHTTTPIATKPPALPLPVVVTVRSRTLAPPSTPRAAVRIAFRSRAPPLS